MATVSEVAHDIKSFKVQGANQIALHALKFLRGFTEKNGFGLKFEVAANILEEARPTAVVLHNCIEQIKKRRSRKTIDSLIKNLGVVKMKEARYADRIVKNNSRIMTYCHSGEAMEFIKHSWVRHKKKISVVACETEPLEQGIRTVKELAAAKIPVTLIGDNAIGFFIKGIDIVVIGADAMRKEGLVNKIGTSVLAQVAKSNGRPLYVVANSLKVDRRKKLKIEERPAREVYRKIRGVKIRNPAFDVTPWKYVTAVVTENGVVKPERIIKMASK